MTPEQLVDADGMRCTDPKDAEIARLRAACLGVISHMDGRRPLRGWLNDNEKSRGALDELVQQLKRN